MIFYKTKISESPVHESGLFADERIARGAVVGIMALEADITSERSYQNAQRNDDSTYTQTGVRWIHKFFLFDKRLMAEDFINHSHQANVLYHCGILFAKKDILIGEEITCDYRLFLAQNDEGAFCDKETKDLVDGYDPKKSLLTSTQQLVELINEAGLPQSDSDVDGIVKGFRSLPNIIPSKGWPSKIIGYFLGKMRKAPFAARKRAT
jgi:hypothetical protein